MRHQFWEELSLFESRDYVTRWYRRRHAWTLSSTAAVSVTSSFTQGREYFNAAAAAADSVRPLLLYYGVLSVSRGMILLLSKWSKESNLVPGHGLKIVDWGQTLSEGISNVLALKVRGIAGTFRDLAQAAGNCQRTTMLPAVQVVSPIDVVWPTPRLARSGEVISLDDILSRDARFSFVYEEVVDRPAKVHPAAITMGPAPVTRIGIYSGGREPWTPERIRSQFSLPDSATIEFQPIWAVGGGFDWGVVFAGVEWQNVKSLLPASQATENSTFVIQDMPNGDRLSDLLRTFVVSYFVGMLVRYYPSTWMALLRNEKGDYAQPLLSAAVDAIRDDFPRFAVHALSSQRY